MKSRKVFCIIGSLFLIFVAGCTIYSRTVYQQNLPKVELGTPDTGHFNYSCEALGAVDAPIKGQEQEEFSHRATFALSYEEINAPEFYLYEGDPVQLKLMAVQGGERDGKVLSIRYEEDGIILMVGFNGGGSSLAGGESIMAYIEKQSIYFEFILPSSAIFTDEEGKNYILLVKEQKGAWGKEYVLSKKNVSIWQETETQAALLESELPLPFVTSSDEPVYEGMIVRFYP